MTMASPEAQHRLGLIFVMSATLMLVVAILLGVSVCSLPELFSLDVSVRYIVAGVAVLSGVLELIHGVKHHGVGS